MNADLRSKLLEILRRHGGSYNDDFSTAEDLNDNEALDAIAKLVVESLPPDQTLIERANSTRFVAQGWNAAIEQMKERWE